MISHSTKGTQIMTSFLHRFAGALLLAGVIVHAQITLTSESTPVLYRTLTLVCQLHNQLINDTIFFFRHIGQSANTTINITCDQRQNFDYRSTLYTVCSPDQTARKLVIEFVNSDVEGAWTCGQRENISNSLTVDLLVAPQWPTISVRDGLYFDAAGHSVVGKLGFRLSLECRYDGCVLGDCNRVTEPLNVTWSRFDELYQNPIALPPQANITDQYLNNTSVLVLDPLNRNDSGAYRCDSINEVGATYAQITVNILVEPTFVRVQVGESFDRWVIFGIGATCSSDYHYPPSKVKLIFTQHGDPPVELNMSQMTFGVEMLQWRVDYTNGYYSIKGDRWMSLQCRLNYYTDMFGRQMQLTSDVMTLPSYPVVAVKIDDGVGGAMNGTYREGRSVVMTCTATDDHPPDTTPDIMQYKWNIDSLNAQIKNLTETSSQIRISNLTVLDSGRYECCAQNAVAQRCIAQNIDVQYAPRALEAMNVQQTVGVGDSVTYYIRIKANPPYISNAAFTRADTQAQSRFVTYMSLNNEWLYLFSLVHVLDADYGEYIFTATNAVGQLTQSFLLVRPTTQNAPPQTIPTTQNAPPQTIPTTQNAPPQTIPTSQNAPPQTIPTATAEMLAIISLAGLAVLTLAMVIMFIILIRLTCYIKNNPNLQKDDTQESRMRRYLENNVVESMQ